MIPIKLYCNTAGRLTVLQAFLVLNVGRVLFLVKGTLLPSKLYCLTSDEMELLLSVKRNRKLESTLRVETLRDLIKVRIAV